MSFPSFEGRDDRLCAHYHIEGTGIFGIPLFCQWEENLMKLFFVKA